MSDPPPPSVKRKKPPTIGAQATPDLIAKYDALRDLYADGLTPDGRASRSAVVRAVLAQGEALLDRGNILAVRAIAKRLGVDVTEGWWRVISAGIGVFALNQPETVKHSAAPPVPPAKKVNR